MKKRWAKPKLVVLVRSRTEENVLITCKGEVAVTAPQPNQDSCITQLEVVCDVCEVIATT